MLFMKFKTFNTHKEKDLIYVKFGLISKVKLTTLVSNKITSQYIFVQNMNDLLSRNIAWSKFEKK
jgi:hypothetical protein